MPDKTPPEPWTEPRIVSEALRILEARVRYGDVFQTPEATRTFLALHFAPQQREVFAVMFLTTRHALISCEDLFFGTIDGASVYPREVARRALELNAAAVILAHNHPSGVPEPSRDDITLTNKPKTALALFDIRVLDHIIVGGGNTYSLAAEGNI